MPEYPDVELYRFAVAARIVGARLTGFRIAAPHLLASVETPPDALVGRLATGVRRIGKQLVMEFEEDLFCAVHLAVAGRFHWTAGSGSGKPVRLSPRGNLAVWSFEADAGDSGQPAAGRTKPEEARVHPGRTGRRGASGARPRRAGDPRVHPGGVRSPAFGPDQHHQAGAHRAGPFRRDRECLFRRDPPSRPALPLQTRRKPHDRGSRPSPRRRGVRADRVGRAAPGGLWQRLSHRRYRLPRGDGGPRPLREALSGMRIAGAAGAPRGERVQLLRGLPDGRPAARGSGHVPAAPEEVAADAQGGRGTPATVGYARLRAGLARFTSLARGDAGRRPALRTVLCLRRLPARCGRPSGGRCGRWPPPRR